MEDVYIHLNNAYLSLKDMIVIESLYALVAGIIITTFIFRLISISKEMISEGKGFNARHFYDLGREYIYCIAIITLLPFLLNAVETILAYTTNEMMKALTDTGVYNPDDIWKEPIETELDKLMNGSIVDIAVKGLDVAVMSFISAIIGSFFGVAYDYIMLLFLCTRYLMLLLLEVISPIAIVCLYNEQSRNSFFTWLKQLLGCYMLYPSLIIASIFSDLIVKNYIMNTAWSLPMMVIFSFILKMTMMATVKTMVNKWL